MNTKVHYANLRFRVNVGTSMPECKAHTKLLDMDASRWAMTYDKGKVTCKNCLKMISNQST